MRRADQLLNRLGVAGVLAIGILCACVVFYFTALTPAERELQVKQRSAERAKRPAAYQPVAVDSRAERIRRFHELFPPIDELSGELERLYALAHKAQLKLRQGEYRLEARGPGLAAYRVTLPVRGDYGQLREFIGSVLADMPIASIDGLRFERKKAAETQIEAQVRLTIHFRPSDNLELQR